MRVLIIESDAAFASTLRQALEARGVEVEVTDDGEKGLKLAQAKPTSAVVLSVELGERLTGGFTFCNRFKRDANLRAVPLLLTSALATDETFEQHRKLKTRADGYLLKPYGPRDLLSWLEPYLPQPPAPEEEQGPIDLASELLAGLDDDPSSEASAEAAPEEAEDLGDVDILDTEELIADLFEEVEAGGDQDDPAPELEGAAAPGDQTPVEGDAPELGGADIGGEELEAFDDEELSPSTTEVAEEEEPIEAEALGGDAALGAADAASLAHAAPSPTLTDPPWAEEIEAGSAPAGGEPEGIDSLQRRMEALEEENRQLRAELAGAAGAATARESREAELEASLRTLREENRSLVERTETLEKELEAAMERATTAEARLEALDRARAELRETLAQATALLADP